MCWETKPIPLGTDDGAEAREARACATRFATARLTSARFTTRFTIAPRTTARTTARRTRALAIFFATRFRTDFARADADVRADRRDFRAAMENLLTKGGEHRRTYRGQRCFRA